MCCLARMLREMGRSRRFGCLSLFLLTSIGLSTGTDSRWSKGGPANSWVSQILIDSQSPRTLYAIADQRVCKSSDGGAHWNILRSASSVALDPTRPTRVLIGTSSGVLVSTDGGETWQPTGNRETSGGILIIDPSRPQTIYANSIGIDSFSRSLDGGLSWSRLKLPESFPDVLAAAVGLDGTIFLGSGSVGVFRSEDRGEHWTTTAQFASSVAALRGIVVDPTRPTTVYAVTKGGLFRSEDRGDSWQLRGGGSVSSLAIDPKNPSVLYAGAEGGTWKSIDSGRTWQPVGVGLPFVASSSVVALAIDPESPANVYAGTYSPTGPFSQGLFKSENSGGAWSRSDKGLPGQHVMALAVDPDSPAILYAGTQTPAQGDRRGFGGAIVYRSRSAGEDWEESGAADLFSVTKLAISSAMPRVVYAGTGFCPITSFTCFGDLRKSADGGTSWSTIASSGYVLDLVIDPRNPDILYQSIVQRGNCVEPRGCYSAKSIDGGKTWAFVLDPASTGTLYVVSRTLAGRFVSKSADGGTTWSPADSGLKNAIEKLWMDSSSAKTLYGATFTGLYRSLNGGDSWSATGLILPVNDLAFDPRDSKVLYAGTSAGGVLRSSDGGSTWLPMNEGLPDLSVFAIAIDSAGIYLHTSTSSGGVYDLQLPRRIDAVLPRPPVRAVKPRA